VADSKSGVNFLAFLVALVTAYARRKVRLVCDNGRFHHTKAVQAWWAAHRDQIEVFWLPPYCPSLNLIERLWGHLKRTVLANVLCATLDDLVAAFHRGMKLLNGRKDRMGFMFNHDEPSQEESWVILSAFLLRFRVAEWLEDLADPTPLHHFDVDPPEPAASRPH
jgi:transposase